MQLDFSAQKKQIDYIACTMEFYTNYKGIRKISDVRLEGHGQMFARAKNGVPILNTDELDMLKSAGDQNNRDALPNLGDIGEFNNVTPSPMGKVRSNQAQQQLQELRSADIYLQNSNRRGNLCFQ